MRLGFRGSEADRNGYAHPSREGTQAPRLRDQAGFILAILLAWHLVTTEGLVNPMFLPQPGETLRTLIAIIASGEAFDDL